MKLINKHPEYLFVYGSLRRDAKHDVFSKIEDHIDYVGRGYFTGELFDLGKYPGAIEAEDGKVKGEVYAIADHRNEIFRLLDNYEGYNRNNLHKSLFIRKRTTIKLSNGKKISVWIYLYNRPERIRKAKPISSGDYLRFKQKKTNA